MDAHVSGRQGQGARGEGQLPVASHLAGTPQTSAASKGSFEHSNNVSHGSQPNLLSSVGQQAHVRGYTFSLTVRPNDNCPGVKVQEDEVKNFSTRCLTVDKLDAAINANFKLKGLETHIVDPTNKDELIDKEELTAQAPPELQALHSNNLYQVVLHTPEKIAPKEPAAVATLTGKGSLGASRQKRGRCQAKPGQQSRAGLALTSNQQATCKNHIYRHLWGHAFSGAPLCWGKVLQNKAPNAADYQHPVYDIQPKVALEDFKGAAYSDPRLHGAAESAIDSYARNHCRDQWHTCHFLDPASGKFPRRNIQNISLFAQRRHLKGPGPIPGIHDNHVLPAVQQLAPPPGAFGVRALAGQFEELARRGALPQVDPQAGGGAGEEEDEEDVDIVALDKEETKDEKQQQEEELEEEEEEESVGGDDEQVC